MTHASTKRYGSQIFLDRIDRDRPSSSRVNALQKDQNRLWIGQEPIGADPGSLVIGVLGSVSFLWHWMKGEVVKSLAFSI